MELQDIIRQRHTPVSAYMENATALTGMCHVIDCTTLVFAKASGAEDVYVAAASLEAKAYDAALLQPPKSNEDIILLALMADVRMTVVYDAVDGQDLRRSHDAAQTALQNIGGYLISQLPHPAQWIASLPDCLRETAQNWLENFIGVQPCKEQAA